MDAQARQRLIRHLPMLGGGAAAALAALFFLILPDWRLEGAVSASGLPQVLSFAQPPLGNTARLLLMAAGAACAGAVAWAVLFLVWGPGGILYRAPATADGPRVRRADAHPDAPPRRPLSSADLGVPPPPAERPIPADLDQPLAAFHPAAIPDVPLVPVRPVPSLVVRDEEAEPDAAPEIEPDAAPEIEPEIEPEPEFAPTPEPTPAPTPRPAQDTGAVAPFAPLPIARPAPFVGAEPPTVESLLRRLEAGTRRRRTAD